MNMGHQVLKRLKRSHFIFISVIALVVVAVVFWLGGDTADVALFTVKRGEFIIDLKERGELKAASSTSVGVPSRVWGSIRIVQVIEDGAFVKEGDVLVQFDTSEFLNRVKERENDLENAKAELASLKATNKSSMKELENSYLTQTYSYEQAKLNFEKMKYEAPARKREEELNFKKAELSLKEAKEKIESQKVIFEAQEKKAELKVKQQQMRYDEAVEQLESLTVKAPKDGMAVLQKIRSSNGTLEKVKVGDTPWRGMELVSLPDLSVMQVKTQVSEVDISRIEVGQRVIITLDALEEGTFTGTVTNVATLARTEPGSEVKIFDVEVTIEEKSEELKPGMTAQCKIIIDTVPDVLYVPLESMFQKEDTTVVYLKRHGFDMTEVKVGKKNNDYIIIEDGLSEGDQVALRDPTIDVEEFQQEAPRNDNRDKKASLSP